MKTNKCNECFHFEVCCYASPMLPSCDSFVSTEEVNIALEYIKTLKPNNIPVLCSKCTFYGWDMPQCRVCGNYNGYKYFKRREGDKNE